MPITLTLNGLKSRVHMWGQSHRRTLLLLHDGMYGADALTAWDQVAPILADEYFVIAPDLLGGNPIRWYSLIARLTFPGWIKSKDSSQRFRSHSLAISWAPHSAPRSLLEP